MIAAEVKNIKASWLNEIPSHWGIVRLKTLVKGGTNGVWGSEPKNNKNDIVCVRVADIDEWQYGISENDLTYRNIQESDQNGRLLNYGDLIIEKSGGGEISPVGRVVIYNLDKKAVTSNFMARLNIVGDINKEFLYYYFRFLYYRRLNHPAIKATTGIQNLDLYAYLQNPIVIPTPKEQESIVGFINQTSGEITRFIQTKQRFIELLKEQRQSIITNAVTKGIDGGVKMKITGIDWMPEMPAHWEQYRLRKILKDGKEGIKIGPFGSSLKLEDLVDKGFRVYGQENIINDNFSLGKRFLTETKFKELSVYEIFPNDILITMMGTTGKCKVVPLDVEKGIMDSHLIRIRIKEELYIPELLALIINESYFVKFQFQVTSKGSIMSGLNSSIVKNLTLFVPSIIEQKRILEHIKTETRMLDIAISKTEREIELIKEYREAIIAEAVTGKIKL